MEGVTRRLVDFAIETEFHDLPQDVVKQTRMVLLDAIGCCLGGHVVDRGRLAVEFAEECGGNRVASVIGGGRTSYDLAAFVNAELVCALDFEVVGPIIGHVCPYVLPATLAVAERAHASGRELITALALAHEIGGRFASSIAGIKIPKDDPPYYQESPRYSYASTVFGGVAGAGKLLGLDAEKMLNAFGIAGASCPVPATAHFQHIAGPAIMVKFNAWSGWVSRLATTAVLFAEKGFTGDTAILDGELGFWNIVGSPFFKTDHLLRALGEDWHTSRMEFKAYPCCRLDHTSIDGIRNIMREHGIEPDEIEEIVLRADPSLQTPIRMHATVESFADAQFTNSYICAVAAYHGDRPGPDWQMPGTFNRPEIKALMSKVRIDVHPRASEFLTARIQAGMMPAFWDSIVEIAARGQRFTAEVPAPKGSPANPLSEAELWEKFRNNASFSPLPSVRVDEIIATLSDIEKLDDITELTRLLVVRG
ncbi:MAG: MmgE/PrpD family protein [Chloroflexi bacterium]|nr:MmgE/PrpD family protein [Chloroflexota bacterium]